MSRRYISTTALKQLIANNSSLFVRDNDIPNDVLCNLFGIDFPEMTSDIEKNIANSNRFNLQRAYWYVRINKIIADSGLVIRQYTCPETKVTVFRVQNLQQTRKRIEAYAKLAQVKQLQKRRLSAGLRRHNGTLTLEFPQ